MEKKKDKGKNLNMILRVITNCQSLKILPYRNILTKSNREKELNSIYRQQIQIRVTVGMVLNILLLSKNVLCF